MDHTKQGASVSITQHIGGWVLETTDPPSKEKSKDEGGMPMWTPPTQTVITDSKELETSVRKHFNLSTGDTNNE